MNAHAPRLLVLLQGQTLGSVLACRAAVHHAERALGPGCETWWLVRHADTPAFELVSHLAEGRVIVLPQQPGVRCLLRLVWRLRRLMFDAAALVELPMPHARTLSRLRRLLRLAGIGRAFGLGPAALRADVLPGEHMAALRLRHLREQGLAPQQPFQQPPPLTVPPSDQQHVAAWLATRRRYPERRLLAVGVGARSSANHWPVSRFAELGQHLLNQGLYELVLIGGGADREKAAQLLTHWGQGIDAAGVLSLLQTAALLQHCDLLIGLDTGTTHLAAALGVPCVVVQGGRTVPGLWDPEGPHHQVLRQTLECGGCGHVVCPLRLHPCMNLTTVDDVLHAVQRLSPAIATP